MRLLSMIVGVAALAFATPLLGQDQVRPFAATSEQEAVDSTTQTDEVAIDADRHDRMTVPVSLAGTGPFDFLIDTGADRSAISKQLAAALQLRATERVLLHTIHGASNAVTAPVSNLRLTERIVRDIDAVVLDKAAMGADGILGMDALRSQRVLFDFKEGTLSIAPSRRLAEPEEGVIVVTGRLRNGQLLFTEARADDVKVTVVVDTGADVTIGNPALRNRLSRRNALQSLGEVELQSATGKLIRGEMMMIKKLQVGDAPLTNLAIVFVDAHTFRKLGLQRRPALLLGMNALRAFDRVSIDFAKRKLRLMLPEHSAIDGVMMAAR